MPVKKLFALSFPYIMTLFSTVLSFLLALGISTWLGKPIVFIIFLPAVMVSAWYAGVAGGLIADGLATLAIYYFFTAPYYTIGYKSLTIIIQLVIFILEGFVVSYFIDSEHRHKKISYYEKREQEQQKHIEMLEKELAEAKKASSLRDEFLAIASHELKTPLTTVLLQIQTTLHNIRNVSLSEFSVEHLLKMLQSMQSQTKRLARMINDLLNISLITTHKMELEAEEVNLLQLVQVVIDSFVERYAKEGVMLELQEGQDATAITGKWDKLRLEQVFDNLLSNALKYGNKKPVVIRVEKKNDEGIVQVIDHGIGIKESEKPYIFSLFTRGNVEKEYKGLGIGLYIAQQIVLLHGGSISVKSSGSGTAFTVALPVTPLFGRISLTNSFLPLLFLS